MKKVLSSLGAALAATSLVACAHAPEPKVRTVTVSVPVTRPCVAKDVDLAPQFPDTDAALRASAGAGDMMQLLAAGRLLRIQTLSEWAARLKACQ